MLEWNFLILSSKMFTKLTLFMCVNTLRDNFLQCKGLENELLLVLGLQAEL